MIDAGELTRVQRLRAKRQAAGKCARCGRDNARRPLTVCAACADVLKVQGRRFREKNPGYMAAYGKAHRAGLANPSSVGRAAPVDAARDPQGASGPKALCRRCVKMYTGVSCPRH